MLSTPRLRLKGAPTPTPPPTTPVARGASLPAPSAVEIERDWVRTGQVWHRSLAVVGYPREVNQGWLAPLLKAAGDLDLTLHIGPIPPVLAADRLRRQRARLESSRRLDLDRGRLSDPTIAAAAEDAEELASALARGESRLFRSGLYLRVSGGSREELEQRTERVRALCASMLLHVVPATFRALDGWLSTLPLGTDRLGLRRTFDTPALAAGFPFASSDPPLEDGVLYGLTDSGAPVLVDRFARTNFNSVVLAYSGAGKSYKAKLDALRLLYRGVQVFILDPEDEYHSLCEAVGGAYLPLTGANAVALNPLELPEGGGEDGRALDERIMFLADLIELLAGGLDGGELAVLDRSARAAYHAAGITSDPATHRRPAPLLADLVSALESESETGKRLAERLSPYATGSHSSLFDRPTSVAPDSHLVCFSLRGLPERMRAPALMLTLDAIWRSLEGPLRRRVVLVDEAWDLMRETPSATREAPGARFLFRLAKKARKRWTGLTTITQDPGDLLDSPLGQAVVNNASEHFLLRQSPQAIDRVGRAFALTAGERSYLLSCPTGHGLLLTGEQRIPLAVKASPAEHELVTSDPAELAQARG
ncbi:MAG: VirB4 family type IV secretion system protein [Solirubrobacteraceae bacterium]